MLSTLREWTCSAESEKKEQKKEMHAMAEDRNVDRGRAIEAALANIEKRFGKGSIMRLGEREVSDIPAISTTSLSLDAAIGVGGVPRGRIVEIYGPESSGKTTLALHIVAEAQKAGGVAAYIDAEHAMDADYSAKLGVNVDDMLISQPDSGEQALEIAEALVRSNGVDVIVVDSVAALVPRAELDGEMGDSLPGFAGALDVAGAAKVDGDCGAVKHLLHFHQSDSRKDWRDVRQSRNHDRRSRTEVLFVAASRHPPHRRDQRRRPRRRKSHESKSRQEQSCATISRGRVRHHVWRRHLEGRRPTGPGSHKSRGRKERRVVLLQRRTAWSGP